MNYEYIGQLIINNNSVFIYEKRYIFELSVGNYKYYHIMNNYNPNGNNTVFLYLQNNDTMNKHINKNITRLDNNSISEFINDYGKLILNPPLLTTDIEENIVPGSEDDIILGVFMVMEPELQSISVTNSIIAHLFNPVPELSLITN